MKIQKLRYKELNIFIPLIGGLNIILKTIIFVNSFNQVLRYKVFK